MFDLYLITDPNTRGGVVNAVREALRKAPRGRVAVQLRAKQLSYEEVFALARELRAITRVAGAPLFINQHANLAREVGADGVHLPETGGSIAAARSCVAPLGKVGTSCHDAAGLTRARTQGADFATLGPVFDVPNKGAAMGVAGFERLTRDAGVPVFALGGVNAAHAHDMIAAGAAGLAVIREVFAAEDRALAVVQCLAAIDRARERRR